MINTYRRKHISFDLWNTLISSNPLYDEARANHLASVFGVTPEEARKVYKDTKYCADAVAEDSGKQMPSEMIYESLVMSFEPVAGKDVTSKVDHLELRTDLEDLFAACPPDVNPELIAVLHGLHADGFNLSIGSNTNFIRGAVIEGVVMPQFPKGLFSFKVYSDMIGRAKPHDEFFRIVHQFSKVKRTSDILHIGDNQVCDIDGAKAVGMCAHLVSNPADVIKFFNNKE